MIKKWFNAIDDGASTFALFGIIILTGINVFSRYVLNNSLPWIEEIAIGLFVWFVFVGMSSAMKEDKHIGVDFFVKKMPRQIRIIGFIIRAVAIYYVLFYVFIYLGYDLMKTSKITPILGISYKIINLAVPIGGLLTVIHFTKVLVKSFPIEFGKEGGS
ncbi:C4-dicarboxylate ABC transporter permease [Salipaludibacillus neizhouensis]|uniref:C4-dicarboxylate ABC transporter permease n=1 Tax=Salipaludibacillus neizhouensis TaxID=885475 RepID=A0A3A9K7K9_9BACI|nr:TRAP transporter small permease [Salipaludibacillus neizhouensis]RKL66512.1 C4-dicarboxylate ABC transporter permease [Salipaludibacillus neizhouensis]